MSERGSRGKWAEGRLRGALNDYAKLQILNFMRLPDARAGSFTPTTADFLAMLGEDNPDQCTRTFFLECKEIEHTHRLPYSKFPDEQRGRLLGWEMAGAECYLLVAFMPLKPVSKIDDFPMWRACSVSESKLFWRLPDSYNFNAVSMDKGSWDFEGVPMVSLNQALKALFHVNRPK